MHMVCRWILISLLVMALPLKGLAAAGHLGCAPQPADPSHIAHGHAATDHELSHDHTAHTAEWAPDAAADADAPATSALTKCTQCAPCCAAVAPPAAPICLQAVAVTAAIKAVLPSLELGGGSDRLERPPRHAAL